MILCAASTPFALRVLLHALQGRHEDQEKVLLISDLSSSPETSQDFFRTVSAHSLVNETFQKVIDLNALLAPVHPRSWTAPGAELGLLGLQSILLYAFGASEVTELYIDSPIIPPSNTLMKVFNRARINICSDGLMTFSPSRSRFPANVLSRIKGLFYPDLLPGVTPPLLREAGVELHPLGMEGLRGTFEAMDADGAQDGGVDLEGLPLFLGQYLSALDLMSAEEEIALYADGLAACAARAGAKRVAFKPHPSFSEGMLHQLVQAPALAALDVSVITSSHSLETLLLQSRPAFVASVFSTGMAMAHAMFGVEAYHFRTEAFFDRLQPWENSNRVPVMLSALMYPDLEGRETHYPLRAEEVQVKVDLMAASMQPKTLVPDNSALLKMLGLPMTREDRFERAARRKLFGYTPENSLLMEQAALAGKSWEATKGAPERLRAIDLARLALKAKDYDMAFEISLEAYQKTPTSSLHVEVLEKAAVHLPELNKIIAKRARQDLETLKHAAEDRPAEQEPPMSADRPRKVKSTFLGRLRRT